MDKIPVRLGASASGAGRQKSFSKELNVSALSGKGLLEDFNEIVL